MFPGRVHGLGKQAHPASRIYAELTGRPCLLWETDDELVTAQHDVVVCTTEHLTAELMHKLFVDGVSGGVPGIICSRTTAELVEVCRQQAAKLSRLHHQNSSRIFVNSRVPFTEGNIGSDLFTGGLQKIDALVSRLSSGAAILASYRAKHELRHQFDVAQVLVRISRLLHSS